MNNDIESQMKSMMNRHQRKQMFAPDENKWEDSAEEIYTESRIDYTKYKQLLAELDGNKKSKKHIEHDFF